MVELFIGSRRRKRSPRRRRRIRRTLLQRRPLHPKMPPLLLLPTNPRKLEMSSPFSTRPRSRSLRRSGPEWPRNAPRMTLSLWWMIECRLFPEFPHLVTSPDAGHCWPFTRCVSTLYWLVHCSLVLLTFSVVCFSAACIADIIDTIIHKRTFVLMLCLSLAECECQTQTRKVQV